MRGSEIDEEEFKSCRSQAEEAPPQVQQVTLNLEQPPKEDPQPSEQAYQSDEFTVITKTKKKKQNKKSKEVAEPDVAIIKSPK